MTAVFNPTCFRGISLRLSPPLPISQPTLRHRRFSVIAMSSSSPKFTLNTYTSPKPYSHSRYRLRADCSGEGVSGSTGDDDHRQNDMSNSYPDRACGGMSLPSCSSTPAENPLKSHLLRLWKYHYDLLMAMKSLPKYVLVVMGLKALRGDTYAASLIIAIGKCVGIVSTLRYLPKVIHKVPFLADLKPSGKNVMEHFHKWINFSQKTIRPVCDPPGVVPGMNHSLILVGLQRKSMTYPEIVAGVQRRFKTFLEIVAGVQRRFMTYLELAGGVLRRCTFHLLADADIRRRFRLEAVAVVQNKYIFNLLVFAGVRSCEIRLEVNDGVRRRCLIHLLF